MIPLTVRSYYSLMWGTRSPRKICAAARRLGYRRLALTDTDNLYGLWSFLKSCEYEGITPIVGAEITDHKSSRRAVCLVEDETEVRTHSHRLMNALGDSGDYNLIARKEYTLTREFPDFAYFAERIVRSDPDRSAIFPTVSEEMENTYHRVVSDQDGKPVLHQPCAAYHFEVRS